MHVLPTTRPLTLADISAVIIDAALQVHRDLGPGLLESTYKMVMEQLLRDRGLRVEREIAVDFSYRGTLYERAVRIDLLVERAVIVELKSTEKSHAIHGKQVITYLRLTGLQVGLLLNFGAPRLVDGLQRFVNNAPARVGRL